MLVESFRNGVEDNLLRSIADFIQSHAHILDRPVWQIGAAGLGYVGLGHAACERDQELSGSLAILMGEPAHGRRNKFRRSEEHTSELPSLMRISYALSGLK